MNKEKMKRKRTIYIAIAIMVLIVIGTFASYRSGKGITEEGTVTIHRPVNSVYYWRTTYNPSEKEKEFLAEHHVGRMYLRMFDVVSTYNGDAIPNATITFGQKPMKDTEIVPTVFITMEAIQSAADNRGIDALAKKIVKRVTAICSWNGIEKWHELQLDCDWTKSTRDAFFSLCKCVKKELGKGKLLSCTIRLH